MNGASTFLILSFLCPSVAGGWPRSRAMLVGGSSPLRTHPHCRSARSVTLRLGLHRSATGGVQGRAFQISTLLVKVQWAKGESKRKPWRKMTSQGGAGNEEAPSLGAPMGASWMMPPVVVATSLPQTNKVVTL